MANPKPCPPWTCFTFDNYFRKLIHNPNKILSPYINKGDTVLDIGPGKGIFTIPMAQMVGEAGIVHAFDIQSGMLCGIKHRAKKHNLSNRIILHLVKPDNLLYNVKAQFALAFWMLHEVPQVKKTICQINKMLSSGGLLLVVEPLLHVSRKTYLHNENIILQSGFSVLDRPDIALSRATLFKKRSLLYLLRDTLLKNRT